jgi:diguanylate cyclase (GGDEF)-like protein
LLLIDLDHFKKINDTHGHQSGDYILQQTAEVIVSASRDTDICCRYGGEEFAVILQDTKGKNAEHLARRIHQRIAQLPSQKQIPLTVSIGISSSNRDNLGQATALIKEADQALYLAKQNGRNRTEIWKDDFFVTSTNHRVVQPLTQLAFGT